MLKRYLIEDREYLSSNVPVSRETTSKKVQSPTENYRDITMFGIKDDNSLFQHLICGTDLCRQPLAE